MTYRLFVSTLFIIFPIYFQTIHAEITDITSDPTTLRAGQTLSVSFQSTSALQANPTVTIGGQAMIFISQSFGFYTYEYVITGTEAAGYQDLIISGVDTGGTDQNAILNNAVEFDFYGPQFSNITAEPAMLKAGDTVSVTFNINESVQGNPSVTIGGMAMTFISYSFGLYTYTYVVTGTEAEGSQDIAITAVDIPGNTGSGLFTDTANYDFTPPQAYNVTSDPVTANAGDTVTVSFNVSESLQDNPSVTLGGLSMAFISNSFGFYTYNYIPTGTEAEGIQNIDINMIDTAGNTGNVLLYGTTSFSWDSDGDGVSDAIEEGGPNNGDGNNDGEQDYVQANVAAFMNYNSNAYLIIESPDGTFLTNCHSADNPSSVNAPQQIIFEQGFLSFTITGITPGGITTLTIYLSDGSTADTYYQYGSTPDNQEDHWYEFLFDGETGAEINDNVITLWLIDANRGDANLTLDSAVMILGSPGYNRSEPVPDTDEADGGGSSGCYINTMIKNIIFKI